MYWRLVYLLGIITGASNLWVFFLCTPYIKDQGIFAIDDQQDTAEDNEDIKVDAEKKIVNKKKVNKLEMLEGPNNKIEPFQIEDQNPNTNRT